MCADGEEADFSISETHMLAERGGEGGESKMPVNKKAEPLQAEESRSAAGGAGRWVGFLQARRASREHQQVAGGRQAGGWGPCLK